MDYSGFRESERAGWSARALYYGEATARATLQTIPTLLSHAQLFPNAKVLDAGCGPGYVSACASLLGAEPEGLDFSEPMIEQARKLFPHLVFKVGDVEKIPADNEIFDAVLSNIVLFHVTDPRTAIEEAFRVLKPSGRFVFSQWLGPDQSECYRLLFDVLTRHADMSLADPAPNAYALSEQGNVEAMLRDVGFTTIKSEIVNKVLHAPGPSFYEFFLKFGVRVPLILQRQTLDVQAAVKKEIDELSAAYWSDGFYKIPMPSIVYSASID